MLYSHPYPSRINATGGNTLYGRFSIAGVTVARTGIYPVTHRDHKIDHPLLESEGVRPFNDYYFSDFVTRIHQGDTLRGSIELAHVPEYGRYTDGNYEMIAQYIDVRGNIYESDTYSFSLDNFRPYVKFNRAELEG